MIELVTHIARGTAMKAFRSKYSCATRESFFEFLQERWPLF